MPVFTSASSVQSNEKTHVAISFDGLNNQVALYIGGQLPTNVTKNVDSASDIVFDDASMVLGTDYTGVMSNVELTYGINSYEYITSYSFTGSNNPIFGYRFDTYKNGTNDSFSDSIGTFDLTAVNNSGIKLVDDSYIKYVSSVEFDGTGYLVSETGFVNPSEIPGPVSLLFWVKKGSYGTIYHLDGEMTVSMNANDTIDVKFPNASDSVQFSIDVNHDKLNSTYANFKDEWVFVGIDAKNKDFYTNHGQKVTTKTYTNQPQQTVDNNIDLPYIYVGGRGANDYFNGRLDGIFGIPEIPSGEETNERDTTVNVTVENAYEKFNNDNAYATSLSYLEANQITTEWTHIATTYNKVSKDLSVYHNGQLFTTYRNYIPNMNENEIVENSNNLLIGKEPLPSAQDLHYDGIMDDIRIYENPLNENDVNTIYTQYYQPGNEGASALMDASFELTSVTPSFDGGLFTLSATSPSNVLWKAVCIADHNYNSRELIEKVINNSDLSSAVESFAESTSLTDKPMSDVVVIKESTPDLVFDTKPFNYVNSFDVFVYAYSSSYSLESVKRQSVVSSEVPFVRVGDVSATQFSMSIFTPLNEVTKYYAYSSTNENETTEDIKANGTATLISVTRNKVKAFDNVSFTSSGYLHILVEDIQGGEYYVYKPVP